MYFGYASMTFHDKMLTCRRCRTVFVFTAAEQEFFQSKQLQNEPKRCSNCRILRRLEEQGKDISVCTEVACDRCQTLTLVPFKLTGGKPVYCASCMHAKKAQALTWLCTPKMAEPPVISVARVPLRLLVKIHVPRTLHSRHFQRHETYSILSELD